MVILGGATHRRIIFPPFKNGVRHVSRDEVVVTLVTSDDATMFNRAVPRPVQLPLCFQHWHSKKNMLHSARRRLGNLSKTLATNLEQVPEASKIIIRI